MEGGEEGQVAAGRRAAQLRAHARGEPALQKGGEEGEKRRSCCTAMLLELLLP